MSHEKKVYVLYFTQLNKGHIGICFHAHSIVKTKGKVQSLNEEIFGKGYSCCYFLVLLFC